MNEEKFANLEKRLVSVEDRISNHQNEIKNVKKKHEKASKAISNWERESKFLLNFSNTETITSQNNKIGTLPENTESQESLM